MPFPNFCGNKRLWTKERITSALAAAAAELKGPLPCFNKYYSLIKKGRLDWPTSHRILEFYGSMGRAWLAAGVNPTRITLHNVDWTEEEDDYLLEHAGAKTLKEIALYLHRSCTAIHARLSKTHHVESRHNQGYLSAAELAREYNCSCHRILTALREGKIKGRFDRLRNRWEIDLIDVIESTTAQAILHKPRRTHKNSPIDLGDYYKRKGIKRTIINGQQVRVKCK